MLSSAQITDAYLPGLAAHQGGKLATLDQRLPGAAVARGADHLEIVAD